MNIVGLVLAILLVMALLPAWPYSASWGYWPSGTLLVIAVIVALALSTRRRGGNIV